MRLKFLTVIALLFAVYVSVAQDTLKIWTLQDCLDYALENNIELRQSKNDYLSGVEDTEEAKAALFPSLSATTSHTFTNFPSSEVGENNSYSGNYGLNASMTLYQGGRLRTAIKQQKVQNEMDLLSVEEREIDIRIAIVQAYMQCLYAAEAVVVNNNTLELSKAQLERAREMFSAGSVSKVDVAQLESQYKSDEYQTVVANTSLDDYKLQLKQLLELDIMESIELAQPVADDDIVLLPLPSKEDVYLAAMKNMPEVRRGELSVDAAELGVKAAKAGFYPTVSLNASVGTGHSSGAYNESGSQVWNRFNENIGVSVSVPVFSNRKNRTAVNKARISVSNTRLQQLDIEKTLLKEVESVYLDAQSAKSRYVAAVEKLAYVRQSYELTNEQFSVGMKNTVELITAQNDLSAARQELLQAKYMALLNMELLAIYQGSE